MFFCRQPVRVLPVFTFHLGCRDRCSFCNQHSLVSSQYPLPAQAAAWLRQVLPGMPPGPPIEIAFFGGTFTALSLPDMARWLDIAAPFLRSATISGIRLSTRPDALNRETIAFLKQKGVTTVCLGVESLDKEVLHQAGRFYDKHTVFDALSLLQKQGIAAVGQLMVGLPGDTPAKSRASVRGLLDQGISGLRVCPTLVLKSTQLAERYRSGAYAPWPEETVYDVLERACHAAYLARVPIIRLGLCLDDAIRRSYLAGLWHESLGHYVSYRLFYRVMRHLLADGDTTTLVLHPELKDFLHGYGRENMRRLKQDFPRTNVVFDTRGMTRTDVHARFQALSLAL